VERHTRSASFERCREVIDIAAQDPPWTNDTRRRAGGAGSLPHPELVDPRLAIGVEGEVPDSF
jgi:hypothetical protein